MSKKGLPDGAYGLKEGQKYVPYVPSEKKMPEFTVLSIVLGVLLSILFGVANAYLGLRVGMTVSASIPAGVMSMAIVRVLLRRKSILENNMVQTIASAGESLAAGAIFTLPALFLWGKNPSILTMGILTFVGGALGVFFMIPIRRYLIVQEHGKLPYPEGVACAEVLVAGEEGGTGAVHVLVGSLVGLVYKLAGDGFRLFPTEIEWELPKFKGAVVGMDVLPALLGVGFIVGPEISAYMLSGAILGWLVLIPAITFFGEFIPQAIFPASKPIVELGVWGIWKNYIRYIGAGAVATGGIISLIKAIPTIVNSFKEAMKGYGKKASGTIQRIDADLNPILVIGGVVVLVILMAVLPQVPVKLLGAILIAIFGFFFVTVSSRIVGLVGSSSNPVSGMTIATLLITTVILKAAGYNGKDGMIAALVIGAVVCTAAAIAGDTSQDLKTGYLVGATPWKQQVGELIGVLASAVVIGSVLIMLNNAYTFGSKELGAPQATLMKLVIEGIMDGNLPWHFVFMGVFISLTLELFKIPALPVAIGLYLPLHLSTPIMVGGIVRGIVDKKFKNEGERKEKVEKGILYSSGLIAGEGLMGVILAFFAYKGIDFGFETSPFGNFGALVIFIVLTLSLAYVVFKKEKTDTNININKNL